MALAIVLFVVAFLATLVRWNYRQNPPLLFKPVLDGDMVSSHVYHLTQDDRINGILLPTDPSFSMPVLPQSNEFTINFWMKPENQANARSVLLQRGLSSNPASFVISYDALTSDLIIAVHVILQPVMKENVQEFRVSNQIMIQRWNMVTVALKNRSMDVFVNGNLVQNETLLNVPYLMVGSSDRWVLLQNPEPENMFFGMVSAVRYFNSALLPCDVSALYPKKYRKKTGAAPSISRRGWMFFRPCPFSF